MRLEPKLGLSLLLIALAAACGNRHGEPHDGGGSAGGIPVGGAGGHAGGDSGGGGGTAGSGGGGTSGRGGSAGSTDLGWLDDDSKWRDLPEASSEVAQVRVREAIPAALTLPGVHWSSCGAGCETSAIAAEWFAGTLDTVVTDDGPRALLSFLQPRPSYLFRRYLDLRSGTTTAALRMDSTGPKSPSPPFAGAIGYSAYLTAIFSNGMMLPTIRNGHAGEWDFKLPWIDTGESPICERWSVDTSPPALFFGCYSVSVMAGAGSNERMTIEDSESFGSGAGNAGLSAWSEVSPGKPSTSRIRTWSPDAGSKLLVDSMPGIACGVAVSADRVAGLRSGDPQQATDCTRDLPAPEFWVVPRAGGPITTYRVPAARPAYASRGTSWGEFAAAMTLTGGIDLAHADRSQLWLVRLTDGKMRRFVPTPGYEWRGELLALDDTYLYLGENLVAHPASTVDRLYRYRLDQFDEIGTPLE